MERSNLEVRLLGPVELHVGDVAVSLSGLERALITLLALADGRVVSVDRIIDVLWGEATPASARTRVQGLVSGLRRRVGGALVTQAPGYLLELGRTDVSLLEESRASARVLLGEGRLGAAAEALRKGLAGWRGSPLGGLSSTAFDAEHTRLMELVMAALEERIEIDLRLDRGLDLLTELTRLTGEHPLREGFYRQLMLAFYRVGRQADAFGVYRDLRMHLVEELGVEPSPVLQRVHHAILANDPMPELWAGENPPRTPVPNQLPPDIGDFTGRDKHAAVVRDALASVAESNRPGGLVVITGMGGVGKSTLAVHVGHQLLDLFPDGQLYVNLHGAHDVPVDPTDLLGQFLRGLGVPNHAVPDSTEERTALYRSTLAGRRLLILLDDALDEAQVRPLLPGEPGCAVLITSRVGVPMLEGARHVVLDVFEPEQALELLAEIVNWDRVAAEHADAVSIIELCGRFPLAVRIAGARLAARPHWRLAKLAALLRDERHRLDALTAGDLAVRTSLGLSYSGLDPPVQRAFRLLGLLAAPDFPAWVAGAMLAESTANGEDQLDRLVDARLLSVLGTDRTGQLRYRFHDLVRLFARERADLEERAPLRREALRRALDAWRSVAYEADRRMSGHILPHRGRSERNTALEPGFVEELIHDPVRWFESERVALTVAVRQADAAGLDDLGWDLAGAQANFHELHNYIDEWRDTQQTALRLCTRRGNRRGEASMRRNQALRGCFGSVYRFADTICDAELALEMYRDTGDLHGEVEALFLRGLHLAHMGSLDEAAQCQLSALERAKAVDYQLGEIHALHEIATIIRKQGDYCTAVDWVEQGLALTSNELHARQRAALLSELGVIRLAQRRHAEAAACMEEALSLVRKLGATGEERFLLVQLGRIYVESSHPQGGPLLERCLEWSRNVQWRYGEASSLHALGDLAHYRGDAGAAVGRLTEAVEVAGSIRMPLLTARILKSLGSATLAAGDAEAAAQAWREAAELFSACGAAADFDVVEALRATLPH